MCGRVSCARNSDRCGIMITISRLCGNLKLAAWNLTRLTAAKRAGARMSVSSTIRCGIRGEHFCLKPPRIIWRARAGNREFALAEEENKEDINRKSGLAYAAAFSLFASVVSGLIAGWLLDRWLGTNPWLLVAGIVLGAAAGFYEFIRITSKIS